MRSGKLLGLGQGLEMVGPDDLGPILALSEEQNSEAVC